jgi:hypothetical protein
MMLGFIVRMHGQSARAALSKCVAQRRGLAAVLITCALSGCSLDVTPAIGPARMERSPFSRTTAGARWMPPADRNVADGSVMAPSNAMSTSSMSRVISADDDAGATQTQPTTTHDAAAGSGADSGASTDAGAVTMTPSEPVEPATPPTNTPDSACSRDVLQKRLDAYLDAMAHGTPESLRVHSALYYTENGQGQRFGLGIWLSQPKARFTRSALDTERCGSVTHAVLDENLGGTIIVGLRLRYLEDLLVDAEAIVARRNPQLFAPAAIIVSAPDPWLTSVPNDKRMSSRELVAVAERFFAGIVIPNASPPRASTCMLRQNGVEVGGGNCTAGSAAERFEQLRYPVVDPVTGLVGAIGLGHGFLVMLLFKIEEGTLINIDAVGGEASAQTGW